MIRLPPTERVGPQGVVRGERGVKVLAGGAISISVSVPFAVDHVEDLVVYHDLEFNNGALNLEVRQLAEEIRRELEPWLIRPVPHLVEEEAYTVFCLEAPLRSPEGNVLTSEEWLHDHRREVSALLTQETDIHLLSRQES